MAKKIITLQSRYFKHELNLRVDEKTAEKLLSEGTELVNEDIDRVVYGYQPKYLSTGQVHKIKRFFETDNTDYFDVVIAH